MYAKEIRPQRRSPYITPPQNYSGTAFSDTPPDMPPVAQPIAVPQYDTPTAVSESDDQQPELDAAEQVEAESIPAGSETREPAAEAHSEPSEPASAAPRRPVQKGILASLIPPGFSDSCNSEFGFEELLLVGLIFLLSQGERDTDMLLILSLLLFYR
ncbi:MAG: hypothetical protein IJY27_01580 [Clostridia bacterium]|nr:hypothetical protein [Clostridia bacterium]